MSTRSSKRKKEEVSDKSAPSDAPAAVDEAAAAADGVEDAPGDVAAPPAEDGAAASTSNGHSATDGDESKAEPKSKKGKKAKELPAYQFNVNKALDKAHEGKRLQDIIKLPPSALQGLTEKADELLKAFKITTIEQLGQWKYYQIAKAVVALADTEEKNARGDKSAMNFNQALDKAWETKPLAEIIKASPAALQGLAEWTNDHLAALKIKSIKDLANWKFARWSEALAVLAAYENADHSSA